VKTEFNRRKVNALLALLAVATIWGATLTRAQQRGRPQTLQVPSDQFPTIQSAINFAAAGDRILVAPGVYNETLTIAKRISLTGSGERGERRTEIVGPAPTEIVPLERAIGVVNYQPDGGGKIESLLIRGGAGAGILGVAIEGRFPAPLEVKQVIIHQGVRGMAGSFTDFSAEECKVADMLWHGFSIKAKGKILFDDCVVELCGGLGCYVNNTETGSGDVSLLNDTFGVNSGGGILIFGNAKPVGVTKCYLYANRYAGIRLKDVGLAAICHNFIKLTQPRKFDGKFGDGIVAECSENVIVCQDGQNFALDYLPPGIEDSARAGVTTIGSNLSLTNVKFECNLIDLDAEDGSLTGCPNHPGSFDDKGGNVCGCDGANIACQVKSLNLDPPDPLPQP
jgi:Right handed beta helix region